MRRREFITLAGGAAVAWPHTVSAQRPPVPTVGVLYAGSLAANANSFESFRKGLSEAGYVEGKNVAIEYRSAENDLDLLPELAADLVRRQVAVIYTPGNATAVLVAKAATTTIPIVFAIAGDPIGFGFIASINRPGSNITGIIDMGVALSAKRLEFLKLLVPEAVVVAILNTSGSRTVEHDIRNIHAGARTLGLDIFVRNANTEKDIDTAFEMIAQKRADALSIIPNSLFLNRRTQIVALSAYYKIPTIYPLSEFVEIGGLMSYGSSLSDRSRRGGIYTGLILNGKKPADLPVQRATKFDLVINLTTAKALGLNVPRIILARADKVIE